MNVTDSNISDNYLNASNSGLAASIPTVVESNSDSLKRSRPAKIENDGSLTDILSTVRDLTGDWPRSVAGNLFIDDPVAGITSFDRHKAAGLFGWLRSKFEVQWRTGAGVPTQAEFFAEMERTAPRYDSVELLPHEPQIDDIYYRPFAAETSDGTSLNELLDRFNPETTVDRDLIQAAFMTPFWGGQAGRRPAFAITSDAGRGAGKSTIPELISKLCGGHIDVSAGGDIEQLKTRMLTISARSNRIAVIDNVKSFRFSWAEFEALLTSPRISGRQLYAGEGQRPNLLTWFITLNGIALATDIAQRCVIIKIKKAEYSGSWLEDTYQFVDENRRRIIADILALLRAEPYELSQYTRWGTWEKGVMSRLPEPNEAQRVILERQAAANVELDEAEILEDFFAAELDRLGYDSQETRVRIPVARAAEWFKRATGDARLGTTGASKRLRQMISEEQITKLEEDPGRTYGRSFIWSPSFDSVFESIENDLEARVEQYAYHR